MARLSRRLVGSCLALGLVGASVARANESAKAAAESLFEDGKRLMKAGVFDQACPKLAESNRLDPGVGTLLYLAECYERGGRLAAAWATFREAEGAAAAAKQDDRRKAAGKRAAALEGRIIRVTLRLTKDVPGLELRFDGNVVSPALVGTPFAVDAGSHVVAATAPGRMPWTEPLSVVASRDIVVPALDPAEQPAPVASISVAETSSAGPPTVAPEVPSPSVVAPAPRAAHEWPASKRAGVAVGAVGVVSLTAGAYFGLRAFSKWSATKDGCVGSRCTDAGLQDVDDARSAARLSNVFVALGAVGVGAGFWLWRRSPGGPTVGLSLTPAGATLRGGF